MSSVHQLVTEWSLNGRTRPVGDHEVSGLIDDAFRMPGPVDLMVTLSDGRVVNAFLNPERAFVLIMREPGDVGRVAVGSPGGRAEWRFRLSNRQEDVYPDDMTIGRDLAKNVVRAVALGLELPAGVSWTS